MQIKRILCILLCLTMSVGLLAGCGDKTPSDAEKNLPTRGISTTEEASPTEVPTDKSVPTAAPTNTPVPTVTPAPTATPAPVVVPLSDPVDTALWQIENTSDLMDIAYYTGDLINCGELSASGDIMMREVWFDEEYYYVIKDYVVLLCTKYSYEQVTEPYENSWGGTTIVDILLRYTGDNPGPDEHIGGLHGENRGDMRIFGSSEYGRMELNIFYDNTLSAGDDGWRHGQIERVSIQPGTSAEAGLEFYDGTYRTTDGRLSTTLGCASILTGDETVTYDARYEINQSKKRLAVFVENKYGDAILFAYVPTLDEWHVGLYPATEFVINSEPEVRKGGVVDRLPGYHWSNMFAALHNDKYVFPVSVMSGEMTGLGVRVMYRDEKVMVIYTYATFRSEPTITEALIAVNIDVEPVSEQKQESSSGSGDGQRMCISCSGSGRCSYCRGSGRENNWIAGTNEYVNQNCSYCLGNGKCRSCFGSGKK